MHNRSAGFHTCDALAHDFFRSDRNPRLQPPRPRAIQCDFDPSLFGHQSVLILRNLLTQNRKKDHREIGLIF